MVSEWHAKYVSWLSRGVAEHGADVRLLTRDHDLEFGGDVGHVEPGTMARWVAETLEGRVRHFMLPGRVRDVRAARAALGLHRHLGSFDPDVIHLQDAVAQDVRLLLIARAGSGSYALTIHDVQQHPGDRVRGGRTARVRRWLIANAGLIFVHSAALRDFLIEAEQPSAPVVVVPHGTAAPSPRPLARDPRILFFGRITTYKGVDVLLDAMQSVWSRLPNAHLTIAGSGELGEHSALADARVTIRNDYIPEEEMDGLLADPRAVVLPYTEASQSGVGARAKAMGRPLVVTDVGGLPDLVADGSGSLVPPGQPQALADALVDVLGTPNLAEGMSARAVESVADMTWDRVGARTLEAYKTHLLKLR